MMVVSLKGANPKQGRYRKQPLECAMTVVLLKGANPKQIRYRKQYDYCVAQGRKPHTKPFPKQSWNVRFCARAQPTNKAVSENSPWNVPRLWCWLKGTNPKQSRYRKQPLECAMSVVLLEGVNHKQAVAENSSWDVYELCVPCTQVALIGSTCRGSDWNDCNLSSWECEASARSSLDCGPLNVETIE